MNDSESGAPSRSVHGSAATLMPEQCAVDGIFVHSPRPSYSHLQHCGTSMPQTSPCYEVPTRTRLTEHAWRES